jgi:hypothetical protein
MKKEEQQRLFKQIDEILWQEWDPIGINENNNIRDEYQSYTPHIFKLKIQGADKVKIAEHLFQLETISMGLKGSMKRCADVAKKIM